MKETLIEIQSLIFHKVKNGLPDPTPAELGAILGRRLSQTEDRARYLRGMGEFVGQALGGFTIDPRGWAPPE